MKKSRYFSELIRSYLEEVEDLETDSEGKPVLQKRLDAKRREIDALLPMIGFSPEMVAVVFHGAFGFASSEAMQKILLCESFQLPPWSRVKGHLTLCDWAKPLVAACLGAEDGDAFLVTTAALEFLRTRDLSASLEEASAHSAGEDDPDDEEDLGEAGAAWLAEQGFEPVG